MSKEIDSAEILIEMKALRDKCEKLQKENEQLQSLLAASIFMMKLITKGE